MRYSIAILFLAATLSCDEGTDEPWPVWRVLTDLPGSPRRAGVAFSIDGKVYVGLGAHDLDFEKRFWSLDPSSGTWNEVTNPGVQSGGAVTFVVNGKAYMVQNKNSLSNGSIQPSTSTWEFDPIANSWIQKAPFPGSTSIGGIAFAINGKGYVLPGANFNEHEDTPEFWEYDPGLNVWTAKPRDPNFPTVSFACTFVIDGKAYVIGGVEYDGPLHNEVWSYDPTASSWTKKNSFPGNARVASFAFSIGGTGYLGGGSTQLGDHVTRNTREFWQYDPSMDNWTKLSDLELPGIFGCFVTSANDAGFVFGGSASGTSTLQAWKYGPP